MNKARILVLLWLASLSTLASTDLWAESRGQRREFTIMAPVSCASWVEDRRARTKVEASITEISRYQRNETWFLGVLTGLNAKYPMMDLLADVDSNLAFDWMDKYCSENRAQNVFRGAVRFLDEIETRTTR